MFIAALLADVPAVEMHATCSSIDEKIASLRDQIDRQANGDPSVLQGYDDLIASLLLAKKLELSLDMPRLLAAIAYSSERHQFQTRKNDNHTPYIIHPMGVALQIIEIGKICDEDILIGALLHDVIEDTFSPSETENGYAQIRDLFGERVVEYVREVSDDKTLPTEVRKQLQIDHAPHKSQGATAIKLSDKLYNLKDILQAPPLGWSQERIDQYFEWAEKVVDHLPAYHPTLKDAVDQVIAAYCNKEVPH